MRKKWYAVAELAENIGKSGAFSVTSAGIALNINSCSNAGLIKRNRCNNIHAITMGKHHHRLRIRNPKQQQHLLAGNIVKKVEWETMRNFYASQFVQVMF